MKRRDTVLSLLWLFGLAVAMGWIVSLLVEAMAAESLRKSARDGLEPDPQAAAIWQRWQDEDEPTTQPVQVGEGRVTGR